MFTHGKTAVAVLTAGRISTSRLVIVTFPSWIHMSDKEKTLRRPYEPAILSSLSVFWIMALGTYNILACIPTEIEAFCSARYGRTLSSRAMLLTNVRNRHYVSTSISTF